MKDPDTLRIVLAVFLFLIVAATIAGNILVFAAVMSNQKLRNVSNMFLLSLSLADFLVGTVVMVPAALNELFQQWILLHGFCSVWASFDVMLCSASVLNLCAISFDRYIAIMIPLRYNTIMTTKRATVILTIVWIVAILTSFVPIETGWHNPDLPSLENLTILSKEPRCLFIVSPPYAACASIVTILLPIIITLILYYRISKEARRQAYFLGVLIAPTNVLLGQKLPSKHIKEPFTRKATVTLGVIVGTYVFTWAPFLISNVADPFCHCVPSRVFIAFVWLGYCNSLANPIIYPLFMRDFRKVYCRIFRKCCSLQKSIHVTKRTPTDMVVYKSVPMKHVTLECAH